MASKTCVKRLSCEYMSLLNSPVPLIHVHAHHEDITHIQAIIVGPSETPYAGGFFHFDLKFPSDYPFCPPEVKLLTTDAGKVRFNPNLYASGKVCLSILGTWPGPNWTSVQSLSSVLLSIQSLMNSKPYHNEPGFEKFERHAGDAEHYNDRVLHETLRVAVCSMLEHPPPEFVDVLEADFLEHYDSYAATCEKLAPIRDSHPFQDPFNEHAGTFSYSAILKRLQAIKARIDSSRAAASAADQSEDEDDD